MRLSKRGGCLQLDISYDSFIRTTDAKHEALVALVLERVWARGDIYQSDYEGYYCVDCEEYKVCTPPCAVTRTASSEKGTRSAHRPCGVTLVVQVPMPLTARETQMI